MGMVVKYVPNKKSSNNSRIQASSLACNKMYLLTITIFGMVGFVQFGFRIIMALWIKLPEDQSGLGWATEENVGYVNAMAGIVLIFFPLYFTPYLNTTYGVKKTCIMVVAAMFPIVILVPEFRHLHGVGLWFCLSVSIGFFISFTTVFTSTISIAITNSVSQDLVGRAMGISQSYVALFRALANACAGWLLGVVLDWDFPFPADVHLVFYIAAILLLMAVVMMNFGMGAEIEKRKVEKDYNITIPLISTKNTS